MSILSRQLAHRVCVLSAQYVATVLAVGTECDIACLTVKDDDFWDGTEAVSFGELPHLQDSILVIGCAACRSWSQSLLGFLLQIGTTLEPKARGSLVSLCNGTAPAGARSVMLAQGEPHTADGTA